MLVKGVRPGSAEHVACAAMDVGRHSHRHGAALVQIDQAQRHCHFDLGVAPGCQLALLDCKIADDAISVVSEATASRKQTVSVGPRKRTPKRFASTRRLGSLNRLSDLP